MSNTTIQDVRAAISSKVTSGGVTCYAYPSADVPTQLGAEVMLNSFDTAMSPDQRVIFTGLEFTIAVYQPMQGNYVSAGGYLDASITTVLTSLGADTTLGNKCRDSAVTGGSVSFHSYASGALVAVAEIVVHVIPHPA